jgi:hypothetical protein
MSDYKLTDKHQDNEKKQIAAKAVWVIPEPVEPEMPEPEMPSEELFKPVMKPKVRRKNNVSIPAPKLLTPDSDSDIEAMIQATIVRETTDQDEDIDLKHWRSKINKLWKNEILEHFENIDEGDAEDGDYELYKSCPEGDDKRTKDRLIEKYDSEALDIIHMYCNRTKGQTREKKAEIGAWASRNPVSLKKVITSIVNRIKKVAMKDCGL